MMPIIRMANVLEVVYAYAALNEREKEEFRMINGLGVK